MSKKNMRFILHLFSASSSILAMVVLKVDGLFGHILALLNAAFAILNFIQAAKLTK